MLPVQFVAGFAPASGSLADPAGSGAIVAAVTWLLGTLLGTVATTIAIIAVAAVGLMMLAGRVNIRHGLTVIVGSFILLGASTIAAGIQASLAGGGEAPHLPPPSAAPPPAPPPPAAQPANPDPYAGAAVPQR